MTSGSLGYGGFTEDQLGIGGARIAQGGGITLQEREKGKAKSNIGAGGGGSEGKEACFRGGSKYGSQKQLSCRTVKGESAGGGKNFYQEKEDCKLRDLKP